MTYLADDSSIQDSKPIELYEFTDTLGVVTRRTSYQRDTPYAGFTYVATAGLKRGQLAIVQVGSDIPEMTVELPLTDPIVTAYAGTGVPPQKWRVKIVRVQRRSGEFATIWDGYVRSCDISSRQRTAVFAITASSGDKNDAVIPKMVLTTLCNHVLYDSLCGIARASHAITPTIVSISGRDIVVSSLGTFSATDAEFGECWHPTSGEKRSIVKQVGTTITLDVPLPSLGATAAANGQTLTLYRGCNRTITRCRTGFNNVPNFGGHPHSIKNNHFWPDTINKLLGS